MLARINKRIGKMVFCYLNGRHSIPLMVPIARENPDVEFYFHSRSFAGVDFMATPMSKFPNAHFVGDFDELKFTLNLFGAFITTDANAARSHVYSLKLVSMFKQLGIPVFELQHGLFQIGLHYYDVPSGVSFWGDSLPSKSFAERVLTFYPPIVRTPPSTVIGYPPYSGERPNGCDGEYLLILTNLHWPTYTTNEKMAFLDAVAAFVEAHPGLPAVWKMHHAETPPASKINQMVAEVLGRHPDANRRIRFAHLDEGLKGLSAAEIIAGAKYVVSTVSTVLLDCEIHGRPTAVYSCASNACLVKMIESADTFSDGDSLTDLFRRGLRPVCTGKLRPYDNAAFRAALDASYKPSPITQEKFLSLLLSQTFRDDFIARNTAAKDATIAALRKSDDARGTAIADMKVELEDAIRENGKVAAERDAARDELAAVKGARDELQAEIAKANGESVRLETLLAELKKDVDALTDARCALEGRNAAVVAERDSLRLQLTALQASADALKGERDALADNLAALQASADALKGERDALADNLVASQASADALKGERDALADNLAVSQKKAGTLKNERDALADNLAASQKKAGTLKNERDALAGNLKTTKSSLDKTTRRLDAVRREARHLREQLESRSWRKRIHRLMKGLLPYGVVCTWKRMAYGICEDRPLFAYPGFFRRCWRIVKFLLPHFVVAPFNRAR